MKLNLWELWPDFRRLQPSPTTDPATKGRRLVGGYKSASPEQRQAVREKMQTNPQIQQRRDAAREPYQSASPEQRQVFKEKVQQRPLNQQQVITPASVFNRRRLNNIQF
ncbi:hypothetical protein ACLK1S_00800 [Escherichia coli]